jgi:hypothetical protein
VEDQFRRNPRIETAPLDEEVILFDPPNSKFLILNGAGSYLWERLSEPQTAEGLARSVCERFSGIELRGALSDVAEIIEQMISHELVIRSDVRT